MSVKLLNICRGDGKVFEHLRVEGALGFEVALNVTLSNGEKVASALYPLSEDEFVAVFPQVESDLTLIISHILERGSEEIAQLSYKPSIARWQSRLNYKRRPAECDLIRNFDSHRRVDASSFDLLTCIPDGDEFVFRGLVRVPCTQGEPSVEIFNAMHCRLDASISVVGIKRTKSAYGQVEFFEMTFSCRLGYGSDSYIFEFYGTDYPEKRSFFCMEKAERDYRLDKWRSIRVRADQDPRYSEWVLKHRCTPDMLAEQRMVSSESDISFSVIVPVGDCDVAVLRDTVNSVLAQSFSSWELILVGTIDANCDFGPSDARIKQVFASGLDYASSIGMGIDCATGSFVCFLGAGDVIEPGALFEYASYAGSARDCAILYCDEDVLRSDGTYATPFFKPDYSIDLLRSFNYIQHFLCVRNDIAKDAFSSDSGLRDAFEYALLLKAYERGIQVGHVSRVLYHSRAQKSPENCNVFAPETGLKVVSDHLMRMGLNAQVSNAGRPCHYRVNYLNEDTPLVSIIIPSKDAVAVLDRCITSVVEKSTYSNYEVVIVENNSTEQATFDYYKRICNEYSNIRVVFWPAEFNFSRIVNFGVQHAQGDYLLLLNNDTEVITPDWIERLIGFSSRSDVGAVGVRLFYGDDVLQHGGVLVGGTCAGHTEVELPRGQRGYFNLEDSTRDLSAVTAACMMVDRTSFELVRGFTEDLGVAYNDVDFCLKLREQNLLVVYTPEVELYHLESFSRGREDTVQKKIRFQQEEAYMHLHWAKYYAAGDPFVNINFAKEAPNCWFYGLGD